MNLLTEYIQWGFAGFAFLMLILLFRTLSDNKRERQNLYDSAAKERDKFYKVANDGQHELIEALEKQSESNLKQASATLEMSKTIESLKELITKT